MAAMIQITHGAAMCNLTIVQFGRQSLQMYRLTKQWQPNRYLILLVRQGILYFFAYVAVSSFPYACSVAIQECRLANRTHRNFHVSVFLNALINLLRGSGELPMGGWQAVVFFILEYVPMYTLTPRFILSIRELYARDVAGRRGEGIDTGFGLSLSGRDAVGTAMVFADVQQNGRSEDVEEIPMEVATTQAK
ncbi:hypothetical protein OG21DRAFT_749256 [Imleria badia]|nr:hypothetical protein OG21DRAFT_749256 [Imleria badia]